MAIARITQRWTDGNETVAEIHVASSYPDALDQARTQAVKLWRETCCEPDMEPQADFEFEAEFEGDE